MKKDNEHYQKEIADQAALFKRAQGDPSF